MILGRREGGRKPIIARNFSTVFYCRHCGAVMRESPITESEIKVLRAYARGLTTREIAQEFFVSIKTVEAQRASLLRKLGMRTVPEAVVWAVQVGMITRNESV